MAGPKRFGIESDIERERRFRRIEEELHRLRNTVNQPSAGSFSRSRVAPPRVTGLSLDNAVVGGLAAKWNAVPNPDIVRYRVEVSTSQSFSSDTTTVLKISPSDEPNVVFGEAVANTTHYVRVRAETSRENGAWSSTLNTTTGIASTADIDAAATTQLATFTKSSGFTELDTDGETETYGPLTIEVDAQGIVVPFIIFQFDYDSKWNDDGIGNPPVENNVVVEFLRRLEGGADTVIESAQIDFKSTVPSVSTQTARMTAPAFASPDEPGEGTFEYRIRVTVNIDTTGQTTPNANLSFQGVNLKMRFFEYKR